VCAGHVSPGDESLNGKVISDCGKADRGLRNSWKAGAVDVTDDNIKK
jgi:hypothetical protein